MKRNQSATIAGKRWRLDWSKPPVIDGEDAWARCHHEQKRIQIDPIADEETTATCLIDEVCHAHFPCLDNDAVDAFSDDLFLILKKADLIKDEP